MTTPKSMTRQELLELAALDAFGLLDEYEAALYDRSFHDAPAAVQDEIIQLQAELVSDESLLPDVKPSPELRELVLAAVSRAIDAETAFTPLATIGSIGRGGNGGMAMAAGGIPLGRSGQFWRAAAFVLAGVVIVVAYFWSEASRQSTRIAELAMNQTTVRQLEDMIGPTFKDFVSNPNCTGVSFKPASPDVDGNVYVLLNDVTNEAFLCTMRLPEATGYKLRVTTDGGARELASLDSNGFIAATPIGNLEVAALHSAVWELTNSAGVVLFRST